MLPGAFLALYDQEDLLPQEAGLEDGAREELQLAFEAGARGPGPQVQAQLEAGRPLAFEGADPRGAPLGRALPVDAAERIARAEGPGAFRGEGSRLGQEEPRLPLGVPGQVAGPRVGQDEQLVVQGEAPGLFQEAEGGNGSSARGGRPGTIPAARDARGAPPGRPPCFPTRPRRSQDPPWPAPARGAPPGLGAGGDGRPRTSTESRP